MNPLRKITANLKNCIAAHPDISVLNLQYKLSKPSVLAKQEPLLQKIMWRSMTKTQVFKGPTILRFKKLHFKSFTSLQDFQLLEQNLNILHELQRLKKIQYQRLYVNSHQQKLMFDKSSQKWENYKINKLFLPLYEVARSGKFYRISLIEEKKKDIQTTELVMRFLRNINQQPEMNEMIPKSKQSNVLRIKEENYHPITKQILIVASKIYQVEDLPMYSKLIEYIENIKDSPVNPSQFFTKQIEQTLRSEQYWKHEVDLKFSPECIKEFRSMSEQQITNKVDLALQLFSLLSQKSNKFSFKKILNLIKQLNKK